MNHLSCLVLGILLVLGMNSSRAQEPSEFEPEPALEARLAADRLLLDVIRYDGGFVAVGQRGHVLLSDDGQVWKQADQVPAQSTLTRVTTEGRRLWTVGHDSVILSSADGGQTWFTQNWDPAAQEPLLDVEFLTALKGFAVGAYGRFMSTTDGGVTWEVEHIQDRLAGEAINWAAIAAAEDGITTLPDDVDMESNQETASGEEIFVDKGCYEFMECHLNDLLVLSDDRLMIAAERGYGFRSVDEGASWESFRFPYTGSMFGMIELDGCIIAYGLRGNIQKSCDFGDSWERLDYDGDQTLMGATDLGNDRVVMVGAAATRVLLDAEGNLEIQSDRLGSDYAAVLAEDDHLILVGEDGVRYD